MPDVILVYHPITRQQLKEIAVRRFGDLVKAVVDIKQGIMAVGGELHADEEAFLLDRGSAQKDLWGINLYPGLDGSDLVEFDSMINIRPQQKNLSRSVEDRALRNKITLIVAKLISN